MSTPHPAAQSSSPASLPQGAGATTRVVHKTPAKRPSVTSILSAAKVSSATRELDISFAYDVTPQVLRVLCQSMPQLRKLTVREVGLTHLPEEVGDLEHLRELDVSHNSLTALPGRIGALQELQHLNLSRNSIAVLPNVLGGMVNLRLLNANYNALTALPRSLGELSALRVLRLGANSLHDLPPEFALMNDLRLVQLAYNDLQEVPHVLWQLNELKVVDLSFNAIDTWPKSHVLPQSLSSLNVTGNPFTEVPKSLVAAQSHELKIVGLPKTGTRITQVTLPPKGPAAHRASHEDDRLALNATQDLTGILFAGLGDFAVPGEPSTSPEAKPALVGSTQPDHAKRSK